MNRRAFFQTFAVWAAAIRLHRPADYIVGFDRAAGPDQTGYAVVFDEVHCWQGNTEATRALFERLWSNPNARTAPFIFWRG